MWKGRALQVTGKGKPWALGRASAAHCTPSLFPCLRPCAVSGISVDHLADLETAPHGDTKQIHSCQGHRTGGRLPGKACCVRIDLTLSWAQLEGPGPACRVTFMSHQSSYMESIRLIMFFACWNASRGLMGQLIPENYFILGSPKLCSAASVAFSGYSWPAWCVVPCEDPVV